MTQSEIEQQVYYWIKNRAEYQIRSQSSKSADDRVWVTVWWESRRAIWFGAWSRIRSQVLEDTSESKSSG